MTWSRSYDLVIGEARDQYEVDTSYEYLREVLRVSRSFGNYRLGILSISYCDRLVAPILCVMSNTRAVVMVIYYSCLRVYIVHWLLYTPRLFSCISLPCPKL